MIRKTISALTALMMLLTAFVAAAETAPEPDYTTGTPWLYVDLIGNVTEETEANLKDNFALAANKEKLLKLEIPTGYPCIGIGEERVLQTQKDLARMFTEGTAVTREAKLAFDLFALLTDWDSRNAAGVAPLKKQTDAVEQIASLDELNRYFTEVAPEEQLACPWDCVGEKDDTNSEQWVIEISWTNLLVSDSAEYTSETPSGKKQLEAKIRLARNMLAKLGYTAEEADAKIEACLSLERMLAPTVYTMEEQTVTGFEARSTNPRTREELAEAGGRIPLLAYIEKAVGLPAFDRYNVLAPENLAALSRLYTDENLEMIKSYVIVHGVIDRAGDLDRESYEWKYVCDHVDFGEVTIPDDAASFSQYVTDRLPWAVARLYTETYLKPEDKERLTSLAEDMVAAYHRIIEEAEFLSDETKAKAIDKLESIRFLILYPDDWTPYNYDGLEIKTAGEGGTLYDAVTAILRYRRLQKAAAFGKVPEAALWTGVSTPQKVSCNYDSRNNTVFVGGGMAGGSMYNSEMRDEEVYGKIGFYIGHEISHAFDRSGAMTDKNGNRVQWWTDGEMAAFMEKNRKLADYFSAIHPWEGVSWNGDTKTGEACADMGGMKCMLMLAKEKENFDYDLFFRSYAECHLLKLTPEYAMAAKFPDVHPLNYLRINTVLQQFDEFLDFYGIKEGDGMYLAPEDRVNIW